MTRANQAGISLLETMIALAMMAMIAVILSSGLGSSARVLVSSSEVTKKVEVMLARRDLRLWMEAALATPFPGQSSGDFIGTNGSLSFSFVSESGEFWPGDPVEVAVQVNPNGAIELIARGSLNATHEQRMLSQLLTQTPARLSIEYFGRTKPEERLSWLDQWPMGAGVPELVRITVEGEYIHEPPLTIRPRKAILQSEMSLSSLLPPALPSRP